MRQKFGAGESNSTETWEPSGISRGARVTRQATRSFVCPCSRIRRESAGRLWFRITNAPPLLTLIVVASRVVSFPCRAMWMLTGTRSITRCTRRRSCCRMIGPFCLDLSGTRAGPKGRAEVGPALWPDCEFLAWANGEFSIFKGQHPKTPFLAIPTQPPNPIHRSVAALSTRPLRSRIAWWPDWSGGEPAERRFPSD